MRLIDANALIAELKKDEERFDREAEDGEQNPQNCTAGYAEAMWSRANGIRDAIISIYDTPTIDAVEVVRCRNCKYRKFIDWGMGDCLHPKGCKHIAYDEHFCSYGERSE